MKPKRRSRKSPGEGSLEGQLLLAMPNMTDKRFQRSVIYMCSHTPDSAMGLIINQRANGVTFPGLLKQLKIIGDEAEDSLSPDVMRMSVHVGGPVSTQQGFVLHSADYFAASASQRIDSSFCLTATIDILRAISEGNGPDKAILALGYSGWSAGQLESEIQANGWLHCPADPEIVFSPDLELKYERALFTIGVDLSHLVSEAGHA
ncbi:MAG: YqgE/AlgH family protein [Hyphomicrobiaceae bacterium]